MAGDELVIQTISATTPPTIASADTSTHRTRRGRLARRADLKTEGS
jgi:hypothetical protein